MPANAFAKQASAARKQDGWHMGFGMETADGCVYANRTGTRELMHTDQAAEITANTTLVAADTGKTFIINSAAPITITLPSTVAGLRFSFTLKVAVTSGAHAISPAAADAIFCTALTYVDDKDLLNATATSVIGDHVTLVGDGVDGWYVTSLGGTWTKE